MTNIKKRKFHSKSISIQPPAAICMWIVLLLLMQSQSISALAVIKASKGVVNLSDYNFEEKGNVTLNGEWKFYDGKFLDNQQIKNDTDYLYVTVPKNLGTQLIKKKGEYTVNGFGTYFMQIILDKSYINKTFLLDTKRISTASEVFVNGELVGFNGLVDTSAMKTKPSLIMHFYEFTCQSDTLDVIIHVSNYHTQKFGLFYNIAFGPTKQMHLANLKAVTINIFALGGIFLMMLHFLVLYLLRRKDNTSLYFVIMAFFALVYVLRLSGVYFAIMPSFGYEVNYKVQLVALFFYVVMLLVYIRKIFPLDFSKQVLRVVFIVSLVFIVATLIFPVKINSHFLYYYGYFAFGVLVYMMYAIIRAVVNKRDGAVIFIIGLFCLFAASFNDLLYEIQLINTGSMTPLGLLFFLFSQIVFLSVSSAKAFAHSEKLSLDLALINKNLEHIVDERTMDVVRKQDELKKKNEKLIVLDSFKQNMISMLAHDLKNSMNIVINMAANSHVKYAGRVMNNLIMNFLDINKSENTQLILNKTTCDLTDIIIEAIIQTKFVAEQKSIIILNKVPAGISVSVDKELVLRVIVNLITNAVKYSNAGKEVLVESKVLKDKDNIKWVEVAVTDFGEGIFPENLKKVFDKYFSDGKISGTITATGLGLAFCKMAVEAHTGNIHVKSKKGVFSTFYFTLPFVSLQDGFSSESVNVSRKIQLTFTDNDVHYLKSVVPKLGACKIYQISNLRSILQTIDLNYSENIRLWKERMDLAIYNSDTKEFEYLISMVDRLLGY